MKYKTKGVKKLMYYDSKISGERNHYIITAADEVQRTLLEQVEHACRRELIETYKIQLNPGYMTTIACVYAESIIRTLTRLLRETPNGNSINFLNVMTVSYTNRENEDADKDGNINVKYEPGEIVESIMDRDFAPTIVPDQWKGTIIEVVERECAKMLANKHKMNANYAYNWTIVAYVYFTYLFRTLKILTKAAFENGKTMAMINFLEVFELHGVMEQIPMDENPEIVSEKITVKIRPGFQSKLLIKDDDTTEIQEDG